MNPALQLLAAQYEQSIQGSLIQAVDYDNSLINVTVDSVVVGAQDVVLCCGTVQGDIYLVDPLTLDII